MEIPWEELEFPEWDDELDEKPLPYKRTQDIQVKDELL